MHDRNREGNIHPKQVVDYFWMKPMAVNRMIKKLDVRWGKVRKET